MVSEFFSSIVLEMNEKETNVITFNCDKQSIDDQPDNELSQKMSWILIHDNNVDLSTNLFVCSVSCMKVKMIVYCL